MKKTFKVGVCGHFADGKEFYDGQTIKTKYIYEGLNLYLGEAEVCKIDTYGWKKNPLKLLFSCYILAKSCESIIITPAHNGVKVFIPIFLMLGKLFNTNINYIVIGGWLPKMISENKNINFLIKNINGVYVETNTMLEKLNEMGLKNVRKLRNFKNIEIIEKVNYKNLQKPYKLCIFSRIMKEKGIEDAIKVVTDINESLGQIVYTLDIYGQVSEGYKDKFEKIKLTFPSYINYKGIVNYKETVDVLKDYFILLFPTRFKTEGIPGTIIDAYTAGLPVIASNWDAAKEIIIQDQTGWIYEFNEISEFKEILIDIYKTPDKVSTMTYKCLDEAKKYSLNKVMREFIENL